MAKSNYYCCDICERKCFYDAGCGGCDGVDYEWNVGEMAVICKECANTHTVKVEERSEFEKAIIEGMG